MQVYQMPGTTQDALSVGRGFDKGTTARVAKSLEDAGLLRRETDPDDRRINHLYPTGRALALRPQVEAVIDELHGVLYRGLSGEEIAQASAPVSYTHLPPPRRRRAPASGAARKALRRSAA